MYILCRVYSTPALKWPRWLTTIVQIQVRYIEYRITSGYALQYKTFPAAVVTPVVRQRAMNTLNITKSFVKINTAAFKQIQVQFKVP